MPALGIADPDATQQRRNCVVNRLFLNSQKFQGLLIYGKSQPPRRRAETVVHINHKIDGLESLANFFGDGAAGFGVGPVDFRQQGGNNRWAGRHLDDLYRCAVGKIHATQTATDIEGYFMAGPLTFSLGQKIDLQITQFRLVAHIVMAHQAIEAKRRRCSSIGLYGS